MAWNVAVVGPEKSGKSSVVARLTSGSLENEVKFVRKQRASLLHGQTCIKFGRRCALDETV
jgi:GTPase SAR1 family protein